METTEMIPFEVIMEGDDCWPDLKTKPWTEGRLVGVAILDHGTSSGKPSISFRIDMPDGSSVMAQTTARLFCTAAKMFMAKYPDLFNDNVEIRQ